MDYGASERGIREGRTWREKGTEPPGPSSPGHVQEELNDMLAIEHCYIYRKGEIWVLDIERS
jgi:hypothetical protein